MRRLFLWWALMPLFTYAQSLDSLHILIDANANASSPFVYHTFQDAATHFRDGTTVYINPGVYWIDDPDDAQVRVGKNGREPFGMVVKCKKLHFIGKGESPEDVVLASQRGQMQGAVGNFTMFDFWCDKLIVENLTMGNYCNVDLVYPRNPRFNRKKRSDAITQAHVGYVHGDSLIARRVRFISRLNLNPLNGARYSYYENCHFECTDDALNGSATYRHCDFYLYGSKPWWSTRGRGALLIDCDFYAKSDNRETYFCKQGGPVTVIDCRYHAPSDSTYIGWTAYPQPWLRCYQRNFTLNGRPYLIGSRQPQNTLQPSMLHAELQRAPYLNISRHEGELMTGRDTLRLHCPESVFWHVEKGCERYVDLQVTSDSSVTIIPKNNSDETARFCIIATSKDGREAACFLSVKPSPLPPPQVMKKPNISIRQGIARLDYALELKNCTDASDIVWYKTDHPNQKRFEEDALLPFATGREITLTDGEVGHVLQAVITPRSNRGEAGRPVAAADPLPMVKAKQVTSHNVLDIDFSHFYCDWQPEVLPGFWTIDGYKPEDTAEFPWTFDRNKPMWEYGQGYNGAVGMGLLQAQRGARLMYTPAKRSYHGMTLTLDVDPTKTAGQGFGSATGQYMDICLKFDTNTLTGYGLRIIRTTKHAKAVDFFLVRYEKGKVTTLTEPVSSTCYRTNCTIFLHFNGNLLTADVSTKTPRPADSALPHEVHLSAKVEDNAFGGIHIQHTGSCGESTTMLHRLKATWH